MKPPYDKDYIKVMEVIASRYSEDRNDYAEPYHIPIFETDLEDAGLSFSSFASALKYLEKERLLNIISLYNLKLEVFGEDSEFYPPEPGEVITKIISVIATSNFLLDRLYKEKYGYTSSKIYPLDFDNERSVLKVGEKEVKISIKNGRTNAHYILEYIFENDEGYQAKAFYSEIAEVKFSEDDFNPRMYVRACEDIVEKVRKETGIEDFLEFNSGITGTVQINPKYIQLSPEPTG